MGAVAAVAVVPGALDDSTALAEDDCSSIDWTGTSVKKFLANSVSKPSISEEDCAQNNSIRICRRQL